MRACSRAFRRVLDALPLRWLPALATGWAAWRWVGPGRHVAASNWRLVFGCGGGRPPGILFPAEVRQRLALLTALHARDGTVGRLRRSLALRDADTRPPAALLLRTRYGAWGLADAVLRTHDGPRVDLDRPPRTAEDALWLPWLGRITAVRHVPLERALAEGRAVRLLLVLPDAGGRWALWLSPDLAVRPPGAPPLPAGAVEARALAALEVLVRAAPHLWDWSWPRWALRPEPELAGHAPYSRWAPWLSARPRGRRPARPGR